MRFLKKLSRNRRGGAICPRGSPDEPQEPSRRPTSSGAKRSKSSCDCSQPTPSTVRNRRNSAKRLRSFRTFASYSRIYRARKVALNGGLSCGGQDKSRKTYQYW